MRLITRIEFTRYEDDCSSKRKNRAYQIVIINHSLENPGEAVFDKNVNKEELEKIMLSMLK